MKKLTLLTISFLSVLTLAVLLFYTSCSKDKCKDVLCQNGGTCVDGSCKCATGYSGVNCQTKIVTDPCAGITCLNGGTCVNGACNCAAGYEGDRCQTVSVNYGAKYLGSWHVEEHGSISGNQSYTLTIISGTTGVNSLIITGLYDGNFNGSINATASGTSITIPSQTIEASGISGVVSGSGTIAADGKTINMQYSVVAFGVTDAMTGVWTKL